VSWGTLASIGLLILKIALELLSRAREKQAIDEAREIELTRASLALLDLTQKGQAIRAHIANMSDENTEDLWGKMLEKP
jgi:hypothetical protein